MSGPRRLCRYPTCAAGISYKKVRGAQDTDRPFCTGHWDQIPEDLQVRLDWANTEGERDDYLAALRSAVEAVKVT